MLNMIPMISSSESEWNQYVELVPQWKEVTTGWNNLDGSWSTHWNNHQWSASFNRCPTRIYTSSTAALRRHVSKITLPFGSWTLNLGTCKRPTGWSEAMNRINLISSDIIWYPDMIRTGLLAVVEPRDKSTFVSLLKFQRQQMFCTYTAIFVHT